MKKSNRVDAVRVGTEFETKKITRSYCADQYPKDQLKSIGLAPIRLGRLSDTREAGNKTTGPDFHLGVESSFFLHQ